MKNILTIITLLTFSSLSAQLSDECKLAIGTNLSGVVDFGTELPFVDLMHNAREWYTKDVDNPADPFDSDHAAELSYRQDGYPTHMPQEIGSSTYEQTVATIWAITDSWPAGEYTVLWEGIGSLDFVGGHENLNQTGTNRVVFDFLNPIGNSLQMVIATSDITDPVRNIRVLMPGTETTYETNPFYSLWIEQLSIFSTVRFMDWGMTNNWGQADEFTWDEPSLFAWEDRAQMDDYTWATGKGIPYEMMIRLMNDHDMDGWVCIPHRADDEYIAEMAALFRDELEDERHLTVEYSNEIWNWIFGQAQWLNKYGCELQGIDWPEGVVPYVQNCLDIWTSAFDGQMDRITRVAGVQTFWQDVSNRMVRNLTEGSFDGITPTFYFGLSDEGDQVLDDLGDAATAADVAFYARQGMEEMKEGLEQQKSELADPLGVPMIFYEGGQHITGDPFGEEPTYAQAILDVQRDTSMYNMYNELFDYLRTLQSGEEPLQLLHFSFIANLNSRFGSWGVLETLDQDLNEVPAPKYTSILENIEGCSINVATEDVVDISGQFNVFPNPTSRMLNVSGPLPQSNLRVINSLGQVVLTQESNTQDFSLNVSQLVEGAYMLHIANEQSQAIKHFVIVK